MSAPLRPYPPPTDAWRFPPPPVGRRWLWVAIGGSTVSLVTIIAMIVGLVVVAQSDLPASIDDPDLLEAIADGCEELEAAAELVDVDALDVDRPSRIIAQNDMMQDVVDGWLGLDAELRASDEPFDEWVADWQLLIDARVDYLDDLERNRHALFDPPRIDGVSITRRMNAVMTGCEVPRPLLRPDAGITKST